MKRSPVLQTGKARADATRVLRIRSASVTDADDVIADARHPTGTAFPMVTDESEVVWVYAVTADVDPAKLSGLSGVAGEPVRLVTDGGLSAVVGSVTDASFGEKTLPSLLADLTAIEATGRAHHGVISRVARDGPVLPLRLATVYADDETSRSPPVIAPSAQSGPRSSVEPTVRPGLAGQVAMKRGRDPANRLRNNPETGCQ